MAIQVCKPLLSRYNLFRTFFKLGKFFYHLPIWHFFIVCVCSTANEMKTKLETKAERSKVETKFYLPFMTILNGNENGNFIFFKIFHFSLRVTFY